MHVNTDVSMRVTRSEWPRPQGATAGMHTTMTGRETVSAKETGTRGNSDPILPTGSLFDMAGVVPTLYRDVLLSRWQHETVRPVGEPLSELAPRLPLDAVVQTPPPPARVRETVNTVSTPIFSATFRLSA